MSRKRGYSAKRHIEALKAELHQERKKLEILKAALSTYSDGGEWYDVHVKKNRWDGDDEYDKVWVYCFEDRDTYPWQLANRALETCGYDHP